MILKANSFEENGSLPEQERLNLLISGFQKLDENWKDHIRELTKELAEIHSGKGFERMDFNENHAL